ncbi:hypothetical protein LguiA_021708 [Lonicera macranthoides]
MGSLCGVANVESSSDATSRKNVGLIVGVAVAILLMAVVVALLFWVYKIRNVECLSNRATSNAASNLGHCIPLAAVLESINNFDKSLVVGISGFGRVYKGTLSDGIIVKERLEICLRAVKWLDYLREHAVIHRDV